MTGTDRRDEAIHEGQQQGGVPFVRSDTAKTPDVEALARAVGNRLRSLDVLSVDASIVHFLPIKQTEEAIHDE